MNITFSLCLSQFLSELDFWSFLFIYQRDQIQSDYLLFIFVISLCWIHNYLNSYLFSVHTIKLEWNSQDLIAEELLESE